MPKPGYRVVTIPEELYEMIRADASEIGGSMAEALWLRYGRPDRVPRLARAERPEGGMVFRLSPSFEIATAEEPWRTEGLRMAVFGAPGSGKSWLAALLAEQFLSQGGAVCIFEPRAEYHTLKELKPDLAVFGGPYERDAEFVPACPKAYARALVEDGLSMVFYTTDAEDEERLVQFATRFVHHVLKLNEEERRPIMLILEECQEFAPRSPSGRVAPPWVYNRMVKAFKDCFLQGRKLNLVPIAISQRPQEVNFTIRQLANVVFYGKFAPQDVGYVDRECLRYHRDRGIEIDSAELLDLRPGQWLVLTGSGARTVGVVEPRRTRHGAETPKLEYVAPKSEGAERAVVSLAEEIGKAIEREEREKSELERLRAELAERESRIEELRDRCKQLETALMAREAIRIEVPEALIPKAAPARGELPKSVRALSSELQDVWSLLYRNPGLYKSEVAASLGLRPEEVSESLRSLKRRGLAREAGRRWYVRIPPR